MVIFGVGARESFQFFQGDGVDIMADKSFTKGSENRFEAVGNVVVTHKREALYGQSVVLKTDTQELTVKGNIRYVTENITIYGSELYYNLKTKYLYVKSARILNRKYSILGKTIVRESPNEFIAEEAEFSTCRDCPESWSIYGSKVKIILKKYVYITHAFIKMKGVVGMYIPYIVLPIKNERETGLLFPKMVYKSEGLHVNTPWFWAMNDQQDMTLSPSYWGKRGIGGEVQYRHLFGDKKWMEVNSLQAADRLYDPNVAGNSFKTGEHHGRHFSEYEHHFQFGNNLVHHLRFVDGRDYDVVRDFSEFVEGRNISSDFGGTSFFNLRFPYIDMSVEANYGKNQLRKRSNRVDQSYVQILPKTTMSMIPVPLYQTSYPIIGSMFFGGKATHTVFKQNHLNKVKYLRNAERVSANPYFSWYFLSWGPMNFKTKFEIDYQHYNFREKHEESFSKRISYATTELSLHVSKVIGKAYREKHLIEDVNDLKKKKIEQKNKSENSCKLIACLTPYEKSNPRNTIEITTNSYKHSQELKMLHRYTFEEDMSGNKSFENQIKDKVGLFDFEDTIKSEEHLVETDTTKTTISQKNSIELQWNNSLIRKSPSEFSPFIDGRYYRDNFSYSQTAFFNVSQGLEVRSNKDEFVDKLSRLWISTGVTIRKWRFSLNDYYFYNSQGHIFKTDIERLFSRGRIILSHKANSFSKDKVINLKGSLRIFNTLYANYDYEHDFLAKKRIRAEYGMEYIPTNNCWAWSFGYFNTVIDQGVRFSFRFNFNGEKLKPEHPLSKI